MTPASLLDSVVLIPIRSFADAKSRLSAVLAASDRERLARAMAERVVRAAHDLPVRVVSDDPAVATWAAGLRAGVIAPLVNGLNPSVSAAVNALRCEITAQGRIIIAHADLPRANDLRIVRGPGLAIAPDRHGDGSNVVSIPAHVDFNFCYGPGSFEAHRAEAARLGLDVTVIEDPTLALDVDHPADLVELSR